MNVTFLFIFIVKDKDLFKTILWFLPCYSDLLPISEMDSIYVRIFNVLQIVSKIKFIIITSNKRLVYTFDNKNTI